MLSIQVRDSATDEVSFHDLSFDSTVGLLQDAVAEHHSIDAATVKLEYEGETWDDPAREIAGTGYAVGEDVLLRRRPCFEPGQRLEARDRKNPRLLCVATVQAVRGRRVEIHFDGWSNYYDFETEDDSADLAPIGTCEERHLKLEHPKGLPFTDWATYLQEHGVTAAPVECFKEGVNYFANGPSRSTLGGDDAFFAARPGSSTFAPVMRHTASSASRDDAAPSSSEEDEGDAARLPFQVGHRLEARDRRNPNLLCVATVASVSGRRVGIRFDGWTDRYNYMARDDHPDLAPAGTCAAKGLALSEPKGMAFGGWDRYLARNSLTAAPAACFKQGTDFFARPGQQRQSTRSARPSDETRENNCCFLA